MSRLQMLDALAAEARASDDPLGAVDEVREALRGRVLAAELAAAGWNVNAAARRLGRAPSTVLYLLRQHPELAAEARAKGPPQIGTKKKTC